LISQVDIKDGYKGKHFNLKWLKTFAFFQFAHFNFEKLSEYSMNDNV